MLRVYHHIWPGGAGLEIAKEQEKRLFENIKEEFIYYPNIVDVKENECHSLLRLLENIKEYNSEDYILFLHTKGATKPNELYEKEWREYMELSLIDDYKSHIQMIENGYDSSGVLMAKDGHDRHWSGGFYGGNFWWTKVKLLNRVPKNIKEIWGTLDNRHLSEWCFLNKIENWKPGVTTPSFENFNNFYNYIKEESNFNLSKQYVTRKTFWQNSERLKMKTYIENLEIKTRKTFI